MRNLQIKKSRKIVQEHLARGLFIKLLLDKMSWRGIHIEPYLVTVEGWSESLGKQFEKTCGGFETGFLPADDMALVSARGWHTKEFYVQKLAQGHKCFGVKKDGRLAGFTWVDFEEFSSEAERFRLAPGEAYLYDIWIFEDFRGHGAAPYLRYRFYEALRELGIIKMYSITDYFNTPSVKFKAKLGAKNIKLGLFIELHKKYRWTFEVRRYQHGRA